MSGQAVQTRGRPRSAEAHQAILAAVIPMIQQVGYDAFAIEALAARAGVGKATIYRRWASKEDLVVEAAAYFVSNIPIPALGSLEGDLPAVLASDATLHADPASPAFLSSLLAACARSPRIAAAVRGGFVASREQALKTVFERAIFRGELSPALDVELAVQLCAGPLLYRSLVAGEVSDAATVGRLTALILHGLEGQTP
jgi:AcrR family transcriptional regulator